MYSCVRVTHTHTHINQARCTAEFFNVIISKFLVTVDNIPQFLGGGATVTGTCSGQFTWQSPVKSESVRFDIVVN